MNTLPIYPYEYKPFPIHYGGGKRFMGVELEVDEAGCSEKNAVEVLREFNDSEIHAYIKQDPSLHDGFEIVTHPMTLDYHLNKMPWSYGLERLKKLGYKSFCTKTCGVHIHVNAASFGESLESRNEGMARVIYLSEKYWPQIRRISRRHPSKLREWSNNFGLLDDPMELLTAASQSKTKHTSINLCKISKTVEFRFFRGSLCDNSIFAYLEFVDCLIDSAVTTSSAALPFTQWGDFVRSIQVEKYPHLVPYLKLTGTYLPGIYRQGGEPQQPSIIFSNER